MKREVRFLGPGLALCCQLIGSTDAAWPQATDTTYVGSATCLVCHNGLVARTDMRGWQNTLHAKMYRESKPENIIADFTGSVTLSDTAKNIPPVTFRFDNNGGKGPFTVSFLDSTFTVMRVQGGAPIDKDEDAAAPGVAGRSKFIGKQRFQTKIGNNYYILPVQWNPVPGLDGKGKGWAQTFRPLNLADWVDTSGKFKLNKAASEERNCAGCHETGVAPSVNAQGEIIVQTAEANIRLRGVPWTGVRARQGGCLETGGREDRQPGQAAARPGERGVRPVPQPGGEHGEAGEPISEISLFER